jgi:hypothetical protein
MVEAFAVPVLTAAVNFLFGEAREILKERRERRQTDDQEPQEEASTSGISTEEQAETSSDHVTSGTISSKDAALNQQIREAAWANHEAEIRHLLRLLEIQSRNYRLAKEQYSLWGSALVPPIVMHNLKEAEDSVANSTSKLQVALKAVYGKPVIIPELVDGDKQ